MVLLEFELKSSLSFLVARIRAGHRGAETEMVHRYSKTLFYFLKRLTGDHELCSDLYQETFRVVLEKLRRGLLTDPEKLASYIRATARNLFYVQGRKKKPESADEDLPEPIDLQSDQLAQMIRGEERHLVHRLLSEMKPARDRDLLKRYYLAEENKDRLCREFGLDSLYFNRVLSRARERFRALCKQRSLGRNF